MTMRQKIQEERDDAAINQLIETARRYHASDEEIRKDLIDKFHLTSNEAAERIKELMSFGWLKNRPDLI